MSYENLTPEKRLEKICELLIRGIYIHAEKEGWIKKPECTLTDYPKRKKTVDVEKSLAEIENQASLDVTYSVKESAEILKITTKTLLRWIKKGEVKAVKQVNGYYKISQSEMSFLMAKRGCDNS